MPMLHRTRLLVVMLAFTLMLAGCAAPDETDNGADPTPTPTPSPSPGEAEVTGVEVLSFPESVEGGTQAVVCWRVLGEGTIPHTAVHWDTVSHGNDADASFGDYAGGLGYPDNTTGQRQEGYALPGSFCTAVSIPEDADNVYFRAHAMIQPQGELSDEHVIAVEAEGGNGPEVTAVAVLSHPETAQPLSQATVCWQVEGSGTIHHTALHWDTTSHADDENVTFQDYAGGVVYPDNATQAAEEGYDLPGEFCADIAMPLDAEAVYFIAHAMVDAPGVISEERVIEVALV